MDWFQTTCIVVLALAAVVILLRWPVGYVVVLTMQLSLRETGVVANVEAGRFDNWTIWSFGASIVALLVGYSVTSSLRNSRTSRKVLAAWPDRSIWAAVVLSAGLAVYHIAVIGPPIFASSIETSRFDFTSSGLFGLPGRMYLFGTTIAWMMASANAELLGVRWRAYRPWQAATFVIIALALLSGFKGELLATGVTLLVSYVIISGRVIRFGNIAKRFWWAGMIAVSYFLVVAGLYQTYTTSSESTLELSWKRLTTVAAEPTQYALTRTFGGADAFSDFGYFLAKYSGQSTVGDYTYERAVSASIIGVNPASQAWAPPVTIGGFAEISGMYGMTLGLIACVAAGALFAVLSTPRSASLMRLTTVSVASLALYQWVLKGGLAYHVLNYLLVLVLLFAVAYTARLLGREPTRLRSKRKQLYISPLDFTTAPSK